MKNIVFVGIFFATLTACTMPQINNEVVGIPNPASKYCAEQGGKLEVKDEANGQAGYCYLPNGQITEEWKLFLDNMNKCLPEEAIKLVGQSGLTEKQIKQKTKSDIVQIVSSNQPIIKDYNGARITIVIDKTTNKILNAICS